MALARIEHMFESENGSDVGLFPGESHEALLPDDPQHRLPADLERIPPGPFLAAIVSSVDPEKLNGHDAVRLMEAHHRLVSHFEAQKLAAMVEVVYSPPGNADSPVERDMCEIDYVATEIAAALSITRKASEGVLNLAVTLAHNLPRVRAALSEGRIDLAKARVFDDLLSYLSQEVIDEVLDRVLSDASELTTGQLRRRVSRVVLEVDPDGAKEALDEGVKNRRVVTNSNPDNTGDLSIRNAHPDQVARARANVEELARGVKAAGNSDRTLDEIRADVALDLLAGKCDCDTPQTTTNVRGGGRVNIIVTAEMLARLSEEPGELGGYGPVVSEIARKTVVDNIDGEWTFVGITDNGQPVATGTLSRRPTETQKRQVIAQHPNCIAVGCRQDAWNCDIDHRQPWEHGGKTCVHNLGPLCRYHHQMKDTTPWQLERQPNGDHKWTSPLGHTYHRKRDPPY